MYYAVYDKQTGNYLQSGYNCESKKEVKEEIVSLFYYDIAEDDRKTYEALPLEEMLDMADMELEESKERFSL